MLFLVRSPTVSDMHAVLTELTGQKDYTTTARLQTPLFLPHCANRELTAFFFGGARDCSRVYTRCHSLPKFFLERCPNHGCALHRITLFGSTPQKTQ